MRIEFFGDTVERIVPFDVLTGEIGDELEDAGRLRRHPLRAPATRGCSGPSSGIEVELRERLPRARDGGQAARGPAPPGAHRARPRDAGRDRRVLAASRTTAATSTAGRRARRPTRCSTSSPRTTSCVIDESHVAVPQLHGQYAGDRSRKEMLVEHGFRLPSAMDNRPLRFEEFIERVRQAIFVSATPGPVRARALAARWSSRSSGPTGLVDPEVTIMPTKGQIDDLLERIDRTVEAGGPGAGHHPDQEDGRGPDRLPGRAGGAGPVPALRHRHHHPHRDPARAAPRARSTSWSASTSSARASTCPRWRWWPSSTPTRRASCARPPRSSRPWAGPPATSTAGWSLRRHRHRLHARGGHR